MGDSISSTRRTCSKGRHTRLTMTGSPATRGDSSLSGCMPAFQSQLSSRRPNVKSTLSPFARPRIVKPKSTSVPTKTDWPRLNAKSAPGKSSTQQLEADVRHIVRRMVRRGLQPPSPKASISARVDQGVLECFKAQGLGYQSRIYTVLRALRDAAV